MLPVRVRAVVVAVFAMVSLAGCGLVRELDTLPEPPEVPAPTGSWFDARAGMSVQVTEVAGWVDAPTPGEPVGTDTVGQWCGGWADGATSVKGTWMLPVGEAGPGAAFERIRAGARGRGLEIRSDTAGRGDAKGVLATVDPRSSYHMRIFARPTTDPSLSDWIVVEVVSPCYTSAGRGRP